MIFDVSSLSPVLLSIGPLAIRWYALAYIAGFVFAWLYCVKLIKSDKYVINKKNLDDLLTWLVIGVILGGRLGYVFFYNAEFYLSHPLQILKVWEGGMSFHGGAIGVILATYLYSLRSSIKFLRLTDLIAVSVPFGLFFGRVANFVNNELWGKLTNGSWGVIFADGTGLPRHPSQLYEAILEGLVLLIVLNIAYRKSNRAGTSSGIFLILYGAFRIFAEFFREPDAQMGYILSYFTMGQMLSIPMIIVGMWLVTRKKELLPL